MIRPPTFGWLPIILVGFLVWSDQLSAQQSPEPSTGADSLFIALWAHASAGAKAGMRCLDDEDDAQCAGMRARFAAAAGIASRFEEHQETVFMSGDRVLVADVGSSLQTIADSVASVHASGDGGLRYVHWWGQLLTVELESVRAVSSLVGCELHDCPAYLKQHLPPLSKP